MQRFNFLRTSWLQNLKTFQSLSTRNLFTVLSLFWFSSIFFHQNSRFVLIRCFSISQSFPWKYSLSMKIAILYFLIVRSGFPKTDLSFFLYLIPLAHKALARNTSIFVFLLRIAFMFFVRCSAVKTSMLTKLVLNPWEGDRKAFLVTAES